MVELSDLLDYPIHVQSQGPVVGGRTARLLALAVTSTHPHILNNVFNGIEHLPSAPQKDFQIDPSIDQHLNSQTRVALQGVLGNPEFWWTLSDQRKFVYNVVEQTQDPLLIFNSTYYGRGDQSFQVVTSLMRAGFHPFPIMKAFLGPMTRKFNHYLHTQVVGGFPAFLKSVARNQMDIEVRYDHASEVNPLASLLTSGALAAGIREFYGQLDHITIRALRSPFEVGTEKFIADLFNKHTEVRYDASHCIYDSDSGHHLYRFEWQRPKRSMVRRIIDPLLEPLYLMGRALYGKSETSRLQLSTQRVDAIQETGDQNAIHATQEALAAAEARAAEQTARADAAEAETRAMRAEAAERKALSEATIRDQIRRGVIHGLANLRTEVSVAESAPMLDYTARNLQLLHTLAQQTSNPILIRYLAVVRTSVDLPSLESVSLDVNTIRDDLDFAITADTPSIFITKIKGIERDLDEELNRSPYQDAMRHCFSPIELYSKGGAAVERISRLIEELSSSSKSDKFSIRSIVSDALERLLADTTVVDSTKVRYRIDVDPSLHLQANVTDVRRTLYDTLNNSLKACSELNEEPQILVRAAPYANLEESERLRFEGAFSNVSEPIFYLECRDNGKGMNPDLAQRLMENANGNGPIIATSTKGSDGNKGVESLRTFLQNFDARYEVMNLDHSTQRGTMVRIYFGSDVAKYAS